MSVHQFPFYPGTGAAEEIGVGAGKGATVNCPLPAGQDDADYGAVFHDLFLPVGRAFAPELIIVSAGYDAHARDPLAEMNVTERGFAAMTSALAELAERTCGGKLALLLEGGYDLAALAASVRASLEVLTGRREDFPLGAGTDPALAVAAARDALKAGGRVVPQT
jgi:acetoin utilization deacetylase AcuC-like enzyme